METQDFSHLLYDEAVANLEIENPDNAGAESVPEFKDGDSLLVDLVRQYPILYDKSLSGYKNAVMRENCWAAVGDIMNKEPASCAKRWAQLRESFSRERRKRAEESRSGSGLSQRKGFAQFYDMSFLEKHIQQRRTITNVSSISPHNIRTQPRSTIFVENAEFYASSCPLMGNRAITNPSPTAVMPIPAPRTPPTCMPLSTPRQSISNLSPPPSISNLSPPAEISLPKSPLNMKAPAVPLFTETVITPDLTSTPIHTLPPGLLTPTPSITTPSPMPSPDSFVSSLSYSSTSSRSATSSSYPFSPSPPYYPRATLSAIPHTTLVPRPSKSPVLSLDMFRRGDSCGSRDNMTNRSSSRLHEEDLPTPLPPKFLVKSKKIEPVESSFLSLSSALQTQLSNPARKEIGHRNVPCDDAFANLIATELANLDEPIRAAKKMRLLQVLYENE